MATYAGDLRNKQNELIRKATDGSVFLAPPDADGIDGLTETSASTLKLLPDSWDDLGWLTNDGASFSRDVAQSTVTSWGSTTPTRTDVTTDTSTLTVTCQETKLLTIGVATGADLDSIVADATTGEVIIRKPTRATSKAWRALVLAEDEGDGGKIYIARYLPRARVSAFSGQAFGGGDDPITWGVTLTGEEDSAAGYSEAWIFGGPGWKALLTEMGIPNAPVVTP